MFLPNSESLLTSGGQLAAQFFLSLASAAGTSPLPLSPLLGEEFQGLPSSCLWVWEEISRVRALSLPLVAIKAGFELVSPSPSPFVMLIKTSPLFGTSLSLVVFTLGPWQRKKEVQLDPSRCCQPWASSSFPPAP